LRFDSVDSTNRQLTFTDVGTGTREVTYTTGTNIAQLVVGGITYAVAVNPNNNSTIVVDLNGDGTLGNNTRVVIGIQGEGLLSLGCQRNPIATANISAPSEGSSNGTCTFNTTTNMFNVTLTTLAKEFDEAVTNENITIEITGTAPDTININRIVNESATFWSTLLELEENDDISQALTAYGVFFELFDNDNANDAEDLTIEYPLSQRGARVFVTGGVITTTTVEGGGVEKVQPIQIGAAKLASEVSDVSMYNAVVVGGPCANPIAASLLGNPEPCYESVPMNKAIVKLFEHTNGNVALLVNGRSALNTRQGARAVATGQIKSVAGMEAEVTGTTLADVTVRAVTQ
jgi:hypothetical protein